MRRTVATPALRIDLQHRTTRACKRMGTTSRGAPCESYPCLYLRGATHHANIPQCAHQTSVCSFRSASAHFANMTSCANLEVLVQRTAVSIKFMGIRLGVVANRRGVASFMGRLPRKAHETNNFPSHARPVSFQRERTAPMGLGVPSANATTYPARSPPSAGAPTGAQPVKSWKTREQ